MDESMKIDVEWWMEMKKVGGGGVRTDEEGDLVSAVRGE